VGKAALVPRKIAFQVLPKVRELAALPKMIYFPATRLEKGDIDISIPYYYLNIAYLANGKPLARRFFAKAYSALCSILGDQVIDIYNMGPSLISSLLAYYCEKHPGSKYVFIQHAIYINSKLPPYYERNFRAVESWLWSELLADQYRLKGVSGITMLPNLKIESLPDKASNDLSQPINLVIVGEHSDKIFENYNPLFREAIIGSINVLRQFTDLTIGDVYFKPHPRSEVKEEWKQDCDRYGWIYTDTMPKVPNTAAIGVLSNYLVELMSQGHLGFQVQSHDLQNLTGYDDFTLYTSLVSVPDGVPADPARGETLRSKLAADLRDSSVPRIDRRYLWIDPDWRPLYAKHLQA
jgi:hypothetical protein